LFDVLSSFTDQNGNHPVITANCVLANPDFDKIKESGFAEYHYELFTDTLQRYPNHSSSFDLWKEGMEKGLFLPQFHGREHLNVKRWMEALKRNMPVTRLAFDMKIFGISTTVSTEIQRSYLAAFDTDGESDEFQFQEILGEGVNLFEEVFNYHPESFIAPNYIWSPRVEKMLSFLNVRYLKGLRKQIIPDHSSKTGHQMKSHYTGQSNRDQQIYIVRNSFFEPSLDTDNNSVLSCLAQIQNSFFWRKPAVISTHRVNFIGSIYPLNRERGLTRLKELLSGIHQRWPDAEFMTSDQLGDLIGAEKYHYV
jgi:hypothetical protein